MTKQFLDDREFASQWYANTDGPAREPDAITAFAQGAAYGRASGRQEAGQALWRILMTASLTTKDFDALLQLSHQLSWGRLEGE